MSFLIAVAAFLPMLAVLVVVHELGHFLTARAFGVKVLEFGFGFPPRLLGLRTGRTRVHIDGLTNFSGVSGADEITVGSFVRLALMGGEGKALVARTVEVPSGNGAGDKGAHPHDSAQADDLLRTEGIVRAIEGDTLVVADMLYSLNLLPLGGFVRLAGESNPRVPHSLAGQGTGPRFIILSAGAFMNAVLAILLLASFFMTPQEMEVGDVVIREVSPGSPAEAAGVLPGDVIVRADGRRVETIVDLRRAIALKLGSEMEWQVLRDGRTEVLRLTPRWNPPEGQGESGVLPELVNSSVVSRSDLPWTAVGRAFTTMGDMLLLARNAFAQWFSGGEAPDLAGPVGIAQITGEVAEEGDILVLVGLASFLSMNLAIINILPIPMLDGGRLVFVVLEFIRRGKRVSPEKEGLVHLIGFVLLISVAVAITYFDVARIVQGESLLG